jgi:hypothetical protein
VVGLPTQPRVAVLPDTARQLGLAIQARHGGLRHRALGQAPVESQRAQDQRHRSPRVLAPDVEQELALLGRQLTTTAAVGACPGPERGEAPATVGVQPALQRRLAVDFGRASPGGSEPKLGELADLGGELTAGQLAPSERADHLSTKQGDRLGMVMRAEQVIGHGISFGAAE